MSGARKAMGIVLQQLSCKPSRFDLRDSQVGQLSTVRIAYVEAVVDDVVVAWHESNLIRPRQLLCRITNSRSHMSEPSSDSMCCKLPTRPALRKCITLLIYVGRGKTRGVCQFRLRNWQLDAKVLREPNGSQLKKQLA